VSLFSLDLASNCQQIHLTLHWQKWAQQKSTLAEKKTIKIVSLGMIEMGVANIAYG